MCVVSILVANNAPLQDYLKSTWGITLDRLFQKSGPIIKLLY